MSNIVEKRFFILSLTLATALFIWVLHPFFSAIFWALVLALVFYPLFEKICYTFSGRRNLSALTTVFMCILFAIVPAILLAASLTDDLKGVFQHVSDEGINIESSIESLKENVPGAKYILDSYNVDANSISAKLEDFTKNAGSSLAKNSLSFGQNALMFFVFIGLIIYLMFFLFRDGREIVEQISDYIPLEASKTSRLMEKFNKVVHATIKGNVIVAVIQGCVGGLAFWALGIPKPLLWTVAMIFASLIPAVGCGIIWAPVALFLIVSGDWVKGLTLIVVGAVIIGLIDNFLRPILVGKDTRMPDYLILFSTIGGIALMGISGFVLGPLIAGMFIVLWQFFREEFQAD